MFIVTYLCCLYIPPKDSSRHVLNDNDNDNDNEIHLFKPNFIYTIDNKYCL